MVIWAHQRENNPEIIRRDLCTIQQKRLKTMKTPQALFDHLQTCPNLDLKTRKSRLKSLKHAIKSNTSEIVKALNADYGRRCEQETLLSEIMVCIDEINHTLADIDKWVKPQKSLSDYKFMFSRNAITPQPLGLVGIISPWNYPFNLAIAPLIAAVSAGNKVMLKPSEVTPHTAELIKKILTDVFSENEVGVCLGDVTVAQEFSALPFKHMLFTGSTTVGKHVMSAAAKNLCPVTLELGGKSPTIIDESYDLKKAARSIVGGKFFNAGQTCIAPDYILVPENRLDTFVEELSNEVKTSYPNPLTNPEYTAVINDNHFNRISNLAKQSAESCKSIWPVGSEVDAQMNIYPPQFLINPELDSQVMQEEIFGPVLPILTYKNLDDVIKLINSRPNPLTLYLFSNSTKTIEKISNSTLSGSLAVNETLVQFAQKGIAFGGVGESGMGSYHGYEGFKSFSHMKSTYYQSRLNFNSMVRAPYTDFKKKAIEFLS